MTPFYIVVEENTTDSMRTRSINFPTKKEALSLAKDITHRTGKTTWVVEAISKVELPKPEPIVTMKGD